MFSRRLMIGAIVGAFSSATQTGASTIHELVSDFSWGYRCGVKQPLGTYKNGLTVHQITKSNYPEFAPTKGNPDYLFWVDEIAGTYGISELPTGEFQDFVVNPGGMVSFGADGTIWYTYGARAQNLPLHLFSSLAPYDTAAFVMHLSDIDPTPGSTTPCVNVHDSKLMLFWRHIMSNLPGVSMTFRRYDLNQGFGSPEIELELGHGMEHVQLGTVGIEQLWTRFDPRFNYMCATWQYFSVDTKPQQFGSNPFLYTDDDGATWRTADGAAWTQFPIHYSEINDVLVPFDHLASNESANWLVSDLGVSPNGVFWMTLRAFLAESVDFWFFNAGAGIWESRPLAQIQDCKPFACGVTEDYIVFVYSDVGSEHILKTRFSADDGDTWSDPILLDMLDANMTVSWVSFVQPADNYADNSARFFYGYYVNGTTGRYENNIRWIRFDPEAISADLNGDGTVGIVDFLMLLAAWGPCEEPCPPACLGDIDGDCAVGITDMLALLANWS